MKLILAQGNPEPRFNGTRHNVGFFLVDEYARARGASWAEKPKFHAHIAELNHKGEKVLLIKPDTFYNETGLSARALVDFYHLNPTQDLLVIHDDLALPFGTLRVRSKGSDAGNNGIKSLNSHLNESYRRLRVGTWNEQRAVMGDMNFVLAQFSTEEKAQLTEISNAAATIIEQFLDDILEDTSVTVMLAS